MDGPALPDSRAEVITPIADNCMRKPLWPLARLETFMRRRTVLVVLMLVASESFAPANFARAQIGDESTRIVARCIDDSAVAVAHVDLGRVDIGVAARQLAEIAQGGAAGVDLAALNSLADSAQKLKAAGVQNVYAVFTPTRLGDRNPYYVALVEPGRDVAAASQLIKSQTANPTRLFVVAMNEDSFPSVATFGNAVVAADRGLIARLQQSAPAPRPELQAAMSAAATAPVSLLLVPSADQRKAVEETLPELPQTFGGGPVTLFTRGLIWAAIAYTPERGTWELVIQSENSAAAEALHHALQELPGKFPGISWLKKAFPAGRLPDALVPAVNKNMLKLTVGRSDPGAAALETAITEASKQISSTLWETSRRDRLKFVALAMHNYHDVHRRFPAQANYDKNGRPLLSWRVHILPFLEENKLYKEFHLDEPWDSEHNKNLIDRIPSIYRSPKLSYSDRGKTTFVGGTGKHAFFQRAEGISIRQITDGTVNTIMVLEAPPNEAVIWTKPEDFDVDAGKLHERLFHGRESFGAATCDGAAHVFKNAITEKTLQALFTINGGEIIPYGF
jgi:hypothetical protein